MAKTLKAFFVLILLLIVAAGIYLWHLKKQGFSALQEPSALETTLARTMRNMAIPADAKTADNPWKDLDNADNRKEAREHWADHCSLCHANDGSGDTEMGKNMYPKPPDMRLAATQNLADGELYYIIENGVRLTGMPAWGDPHTVQDDDSWKLVLFIRHLPHLTQEDLDDMKTYNPKGKMKEEDEEEEKQNMPGMKDMPNMPGHHMHGTHHSDQSEHK